MTRGSRLAALALAQHGVVSHSQLLELGLSASAVRNRVARHSLHRIQEEVYAVGHRSLTREARWMAAVLACGPAAVLCHHSALALHGLRPSAREKIDLPSARLTGGASRESTPIGFTC